MKKAAKKPSSPSLKRYTFSHPHFIAFVLIFAFIGGAVIWQSFAATPTVNCVRLSGEACDSNTIVCNEVSKTGPGNDFTNDTTPTFGIDSDGPSAQYQFFVDGMPQGNLTAAGPNIACATMTSPLSNGPHTFTANETTPDNTKTTVPNPYGFTVDTIAPVAPAIPILDFAEDSGISGDNITASSTPRFHGTAEPLSQVHLFHQGKPNTDRDVTTDSSGNWSAGTPPLAPDGVYNFYASTSDNAGNLSPNSATQAITIDTTQPSASISAPATISGSALLQVKDSNGNNATDNLSGMWKVWYRYSANPNTLPWSDIGTATTTPYSQTWDASKLASGTYTVRALAYDIAGNLKISDTVVTVSNTAPLVNITSPSSGNFVKGSVSVSASANAMALGAVIAKVEFYVDGTLKSSDTTAPYSFSWNAGSLNGAHTISAKAYDNASPVNSATSQPVSVTVDNVQPSNPPANLAGRPAPDTQIYLSWTPAADNIGIDSYEIWLNGSLDYTIDSSSIPGTCATTPQPLCDIVLDDAYTPGTSYSFVVKAYDAAGNSSSSTSINVVARSDINTTKLDDGTCGQNIQSTGDPPVINNRIPSFVVIGDGNNATYNVWILDLATNTNSYSGGSATSIGNGKYCINLPQNLSLPNGDYVIYADEVTPNPFFNWAAMEFFVSASTNVPGDANGDGHVSQGDLTILAANFNGPFVAFCDFNHGNKVDFLDVSILLSHYGT